MKKKTSRLVMFLMMVLFIAGLIIVLSALAIGTNTSDTEDRSINTRPADLMELFLQEVS